MAPHSSLLENLHLLDSSVFWGGLAGMFAGLLIGGFLTIWVAYRLSRRVFRTRVLELARRELREPLHGYMDWLNSVSAEFSIWKSTLLPTFVAESSRDQVELNRMRKLFVDPRNTVWMQRLEEFDAVLGRFRDAVNGLWRRQMLISEHFNTLFQAIDGDAAESVARAESLEDLSFDQAQLVADFLYHLQYESLKGVADSPPKRTGFHRSARIRRTRFGRIELQEEPQMAVHA
jgi:hypothetical protein